MCYSGKKIKDNPSLLLHKILGRPVLEIDVEFSEISEAAWPEELLSRQQERIHSGGLT